LGFWAASAKTSALRLRNFPEPDLDEAARAADATREVMERWLPDSEISLGHKEATL
jgi:hypothetical protein